MVTNGTSNGFEAPYSGGPASDEESLRIAHAKALAELSHMQALASVKPNEPAIDSNAEYSMHEAQGIGRYVIPRRTGWKPLLKVIHDPVPNIDFSANIYPAFDGIIGQHFESPYLLDPLDEKYESYESLRDNLAAVRNFLLEHYYASTKSGMSQVQAKQAMAEIASFIGDGLYNNFIYAKLIPNHDPTKPFIDLNRAREKGGHGAQYIYECVLAHQRQSDWMRPFDAVVAMFGGKPAPKWNLPGGDKTHFTDFFDHDIASDVAPAPVTNGVDPKAMDAAAANLAALEAQIALAKNARILTTTAQDLDNIGNSLIYTSTHLDGVAHLDAPVRRDAVEIAKDILRKLKFSIGDLMAVDGLNMKPSDDMAALGGVKGVASVYGRLLAWARNNGDTAIMQHPAVLAATQAIGQLGFLAKSEALRMAELAGNSDLAGTIREQIALLPQSFRPAPGTRFGDLLDRLYSGLDVILNRTQEVGVSGGQVGHTIDGHAGTSLFMDPTAGMASQSGAESQVERNAKMLAAEQLALEAQAMQINSQVTSQARQQQAAKDGQNSTTTKPAPAVPARGAAGPGRAALNAARANQQRQAANNSTTRPSSTNPNALLAQQQRANTVANMMRNRALHEHEEHEHHEQMLRQQQQQQLAAQKAAQQAKAKAAASKIDPKLLKGFDMTGVTGKLVTGGKPIDPKSIQASMTPSPKPTNVVTSPSAAPDTTKSPYDPPPPPRNTGGRGF